MSSPQVSFTPEFVTAYRDMVLMGLANEAQITRKVLAAVPDAKRDYRPDPHARSAWELATHIANTDIWFADGIADLKFGAEEESKDQPKTAAELASWYEREFNRAINRVRSMSAEQLLTPVDFMGAFNLPAFMYLGFHNKQSIHHRGELCTHLRPMGSKCPSVYGGSYDEPWQGQGATTSAA
jgi:uncharacterized damage-inducible protein DinB